MTKSEARNGVILRSAEESAFQTCMDGQLDPSADLGMTLVRHWVFRHSSFALPRFFHGRDDLLGQTFNGLLLGSGDRLANFGNEG